MIHKYRILYIFITVLVAACSSDDEDPMAQVGLELLGRASIPGTLATDVWGYVDANTNTEYAITGDFTDFQGGNVTIFDLSDPSNPTQVSSITTVIGFDVKIWDHYVYAANGAFSSGTTNSSKILDIADPANPQVVGDFPETHNTFIDEKGFMYLTDGDHPGLSIFDLNQDPTQPQLVWDDEKTTQAHDAAVIRGRLYDFHGFDATYIYDVDDPQNPVLLGEVRNDGTFHHSGWVTDDDRYLFICDELAADPNPDITIWDISDLSNPVQVGEIADAQSRAHNLIVKGDNAFVSYYGAGLRVYNISDPIQPELLDEFNTNTTGGTGVGNGFEGAFGVYPFAPEGRIYVTDIDNGLSIFSFN